MKKVYLSVSKLANSEYVTKIQDALSKFDTEVLSYDNSKPFDSTLIDKADTLIMVLPDLKDGKDTVGRGQYDIFHQFVNRRNEREYCHNRHLHVYKHVYFLWLTTTDQRYYFKKMVNIALNNKDDWTKSYGIIRDVGNQFFTIDELLELNGYHKTKETEPIPSVESLWGKYSDKGTGGNIGIVGITGEKGTPGPQGFNGPVGPTGITGTCGGPGDPGIRIGTDTYSSDALRGPTGMTGLSGYYNNGTFVRTDTSINDAYSYRPTPSGTHEYRINGGEWKPIDVNANIPSFKNCTTPIGDIVFGSKGNEDKRVQPMLAASLFI